EFGRVHRRITVARVPFQRGFLNAYAWFVAWSLRRHKFNCALPIHSERSASARYSQGTRRRRAHPRPRPAPARSRQCGEDKEEGHFANTPRSQRTYVTAKKSIGPASRPVRHHVARRVASWDAR